jgi:hypothetical protein
MKKNKRKKMRKVGKSTAKKTEIQVNDSSNQRE